jgi:hypothetical protein
MLSLSYASSSSRVKILQKKYETPVHIYYQENVMFPLRFCKLLHHVFLYFLFYHTLTYIHKSPTTTDITYARFENFRVVAMNIQAFRAMRQSRFVNSCHRFRGPLCPHLHGGTRSSILASSNSLHIELHLYLRVLCVLYLCLLHFGIVLFMYIYSYLLLM